MAGWQDEGDEWTESRFISAVAFYGPKTGRLRELLTGVQALIAEHSAATSARTHWTGARDADRAQRRARGRHDRQRVPARARGRAARDGPAAGDGPSWPGASRRRCGSGSAGFRPGRRSRSPAVASIWPNGPSRRKVQRSCWWDGRPTRWPARADRWTSCAGKMNAAGVLPAITHGRPTSTTTCTWWWGTRPAPQPPHGPGHRRGAGQAWPPDPADLAIALSDVTIVAADSDTRRRRLRQRYPAAAPTCSRSYGNRGGPGQEAGGGAAPGVAGVRCVPPSQRPGPAARPGPAGRPGPARRTGQPERQPGKRAGVAEGGGGGSGSPACVSTSRSGPAPRPARRGKNTRRRERRRLQVPLGQEGGGRRGRTRRTARAPVVRCRTARRPGRAS